MRILANTCEAESVAAPRRAIPLHASLPPSAAESARSSPAGGHVLSSEDKKKLQAALWVDGKDGGTHLNAELVAQPAQHIADAAGFGIPEGTRFFIVPETGYGPAHPFSGEKMTVTMALYRVPSIDAAIEMTNGIQAYQGMGHSCGIYTSSDENVMKLALATKTSRLLVNQPQAASNSGNLWNGLRQTFSLGCGSWGNTSICDNINWRHLINETWVSRNLATPKELLPDEVLFKRIQGRM